MRDPAGGGFARNASAMFGARAGSALLQATTLLVAARSLGPVDYGSLALVVTLRTMTLVIAESGLLLVVVREIARGPRDPLQLWQSVLGLRLAMGAVAAVVLLLLSLAASDVREVRAGALVAGLSFLPYAFFGVAQTRAQAEGRLGGLAIATFAGAATGLLYTVLVLDAGGGVVALSGSLVVASIASAVFGVMLVPRTAETLRPRLGPAARRLLVASIPLGVSSALVNVYLYVDLALLSRLGSREEVGLYDTAFRFVQLGILIPAVITAALYGRATQAAEAGGPTFAPLARWILSIGVLVAPLPIVVLSIASADVMVLVFGEEYRDGAKALAWLGGALALMIVSGLVGPLLIAQGRDRATLRLGMVATLCNIAINLVLIPELGAEGAAITTLITEMIVVSVALVLLRRTCGVAPPARRLGAGLLALGAGAGVMATVPGPVLLRLACATIAYAAVAVIAGAVRRDELAHGGPRT